MKHQKRPGLPRGLRWHSESQFIWFTWRDAAGRQHQKSTETTDPAKALIFKMQFLQEKETPTTNYVESTDLTNEPLDQVAKLYFDWKLANNSSDTVSRERRMFKNVVKFFGPKTPVRSIRLPQIREYQKDRRKQISPTMKQTVTARSVNYEMQLLKGVMSYADCWSDTLAARYQPLREVKSRAGKTASSDQMIRIINAAMKNDYWQLAMWCAAVAVGTGCRSGEIRKLQLKDICLSEGKIRVVREIAKSRKERQPRLMALAEWGLRQLLLRAHALGATKPEHFLLPLNIAKSRHLARDGGAKWDATKPMTSWVKSWRKLMDSCGMNGFRFHDLRHTFRTQGAEAGVPLEVMMAQLGHMDRQTSLDYVHIQQRALERAKQLIEAEQAEILASTQVRKQKRCLGQAGKKRSGSRRDHFSVSALPPTVDSRIETQDPVQRAKAGGETPL
jgi:integrase